MPEPSALVLHFAIHPRLAGDLEGLLAQANDAPRRHPRDRVMKGRVAGLGALAAEAAVTLRDDRLRRGVGSRTCLTRSHTVAIIARPRDL